MELHSKILLYSGSSYSTLLRLNRLIPGLVDMGVQPIMIFPDVLPSKNPDAYSDEMKDFAFYDRTLMNDVVIPYMNNQDRPILTVEGKPKKGICYSPKHLCEIYKAASVQAFTVDDVNSEAHVEFVDGMDGVIGGICDRGLQIFQQPIIDAFSRKEIIGTEKNGGGFLWNLHPGRLPDDRGLLPVFRAASKKQQTFDITLHGIVDPTIDTGPIYGATPITIDPEKSILAHYSDEAHVAAGVALVFKNVADVLKYGKPLSTVVQDPTEGNEYSYPSPQDIKDFKDAGGIWMDQPTKEWHPLASAFANGSEHREGLRAAMKSAVNEHLGKPVTRSMPRVSTAVIGTTRYEGMRFIA